MRHYYNDNDPRCARWLRQLAADGCIPEGHVDDRSITDIRPYELTGYDQCHFFAGIGGWPLALRLAGSADLPCWTGSCPCQPFSTAGAGRGFADPRHLSPNFTTLITFARPPIIFGEQVSGSAGRKWIADLFQRLEGSGYHTDALIIPACAVGAYHIRQRLYWCAYLDCDTDSQRQKESARRNAKQHGERCPIISHSEDQRRSEISNAPRQRTSIQEPASGSLFLPIFDIWDDYIPQLCSDGKTRCAPPPQSPIYPLTDGLSSPMATIAGYGNAIVPQLAAAFIRAAISHYNLGGTSK
jgi:DNA (cytosine-5)-methyltransferase 1